MGEYRIMVQALGIKPDMLDATPEQIGQSFTAGMGRMVEKAAKELDSFEGGGWTIVSHALTKLDRYLIVSLLLRR
jgi:hypothetical protein